MANFDVAAALERAKAAVPVPEPPPALLGEQAANDPRDAQIAREVEARLQAWSNHTLAVVALLLAEYDQWRQAPAAPLTRPPRARQRPAHAREGPPAAAGPRP